MKKEDITKDMELIREYTLPGEMGFIYYVVKLDNEKEVTYGKKVYDEMMKKRKK